MYILQFKNIENIYVFRYSFNYKVYQLFIYKYRGEKYVYVKFKENYYYIILSLCEIFKIFRNLDIIINYFIWKEYLGRGNEIKQIFVDDICRLY